jgi:phage antirepressor YoqD-like protein
MENQKVFNYMGNEITFFTGDDVMINATEMAKVFGKLPSGWLRSQSYIDFINHLSAMRNCIPTDLVKIVNGGTNFGTWMHQDVAMEFARWLSPAFAIWCNDRIKELMKYGATALNPESLLDPDYVIQVMTALKSERAAKELALSKVKELEPKALFADAVAGSNNSCLIGELAKFLKQNGVEVGQNRLFEYLRNEGFLCSRGESYNLPTQRAMEMELLEIKKTAISKPNGITLVQNTTKVTPKGQIYFVKMFVKLK